jgi:hypothetical protein
MEREAQDWLESDEINRKVEEQGGGTLISNEPDLTKFLKGQFNNRRFAQGRVQHLIETIEHAKPWLKSIITTRDTLSHYQPYIHFGFLWDSENECPTPPFVETDSGTVGIEDFMTNQIEQLTSYCTHFIAWTISCAIPIEQLIQVLDEMEKRVIGARWAMDLSLAYWKLSSRVLHLYTEADVEKARTLREQRVRRAQSG